MKSRILIVDDEKLFLESLVEHLRLKRSDMIFYSATSPKDAIKILKNKPIDVVVTDVRMPEMSGLELLMYIKHNFPYIKTIVMTAYGNDEIEKKVKEEGGTRYITKPFTAESFEEVLEEVLADSMGFKGVLSGFSLMDILQLAHMSGNSTIVYVKLGNNTGKIWIKSGNIIHATASIGGKTYAGMKALNIMLQWNQGEVLTLPYKEPLKQTINADFDFLILNALKEIDEVMKEKEEEERKEKESILSIEKQNIIRLEDKYKNKLLGLWIIDRSGKVIYFKIYNNIVQSYKTDIYREIKHQFSQWKNKKLLLKEKYIGDNNSFVFKVLSSRDRYLIFAIFRADEKTSNDSSKKGGEIMPGQKEIDKALELLSGIEGSEGAAVVSDEGLVLDARLDKKYNPDKIGALISVALEAAEKVTKEAGWGEADNMVVEGNEGKMVIYSIPMGFIVLIGKKTMNLGLARMQVDQAAEILGG